MSDPTYGEALKILKDQAREEARLRKPPPKICATCRRVLASRVADTGEVTYYHAFVDAAMNCDEADPIDPDGRPVVTHCDFCLAPNPAWTFPARVHEDPNVYLALHEDGSMSNLGEQGQDHDFWAACDECVPLIEARNWRALWDRNRQIQAMKDERNRQGFHGARLSALNLWLAFDANRLGPPYREEAT